MKAAGNKQVILFCLADFAKGIFTGMIANYLIYFFQPTESSGIDVTITQGYVLLGFFTFIGLIKAVGHIIDAITDPLIANWSDKCKSRYGRRMPFMRFAAIPYGLSALLIFCPPINGVHWLNEVWVAFFIFAYFFFYTVYMIPHGAMFPELIKDPQKRLTAYSVSSFFFVAGSAVVYMAPLIVKGFKGAGLSANASYQTTFAVLTVIGITLLLVTSFCLKEKDYVDSKVPSVNIFKALKSAFSNKEFRKITVGQLLEMISMAFFQAAIMYYVTVLLELDEGLAPLILGISIVCSIALYPVIVKLSKKTGKKPLLITALIWFIVSYVIIYFVADLGPKSWALGKGIFFAVFVSYPFAALNVLPGAIMSDVIQYDTLKSGENKEGIFSAARNFITKLGQSAAIMIMPSILYIGAADGASVGVEGVKLTAVVSGAFCALSVVAFLLYNDKKVMAFIKAKRDEANAAEGDK